MIMHHSKSGPRPVMTRLLMLVGGAVLVSGATGGCQEDPAIKPVNQIPIAEARLIRDGKSVNGETDGGALVEFPFDGTPVTITLDGSQSYDPDGTIVAYHWLSGTLVDGGTAPAGDAGVVHRWVPPGAPPNWPGDTAKPQVSLSEGIWSFTLWVVDNGGAISNPDTIQITVGNVVDPAVQQCADTVIASEPEACKQCVCMQGDKCRAAVMASACDQTCWNLVNCVAAHCPDFTAMAAKGDYSCLTSSCSAYVGGSTGATPVAPCFNPCTTECMGGAGDGGTGDSGTEDSGGGASGADSGRDAGDGGA
jgi:hypothetical protein